jgi:4-amino-4-deoxy-L-arabinose transferase-like glycosyltransferase
MREGVLYVITFSMFLLRHSLIAALVGAVVMVLLHQIPASHRVDIGGNDAAYVQGFLDPERADSPFLGGSDGNARWSGASSAILLPQIGLPAEISFRLRGRTEPATVAIYLNGSDLLGQFEVGEEWVEQRFAINGGVLKPVDIFVELRTTTGELPDGRSVGLLLDQAIYRTASWPIMPYPAQIAYGALIGALVAIVGRRRAPAGRWYWGIGVGIAIGYVLLYRFQPPLVGYPLRWLPIWLVLALASGALVRDGLRVAARWPRLVGFGLPLVTIICWLGATLLAARDHLTIARPGVENDFRVFATRETLAQVFQADGFYNLGYPLLLWLVRPLTEGNAFLAGRLLAALCGVALLFAGYSIARSLAGQVAGWFALIGLALSGMVAQYGLYIGSDMPFAACFAGSVAVLLHNTPHSSQRSTGTTLQLVIAGLLCGAAFLMRHLGLVLVLWGVIHLLLLANWRWAEARRSVALFLLGAALACAPQIIINLAQTGNPLYNQQAKNIWLAVYANTDWGRWEEAPNTVSLSEVVLRDPPRFFTNWWRNIVAFVGTGAEDTSEFGRAIQLRLLGFPLNWLALAGLLAWVVEAGRRRQEAGGRRQEAGRRRQGAGGRAQEAGGAEIDLLIEETAMRVLPASCLLLILLYVLAVCMAFALPRFFLPLAPIYAAAAGALLVRMVQRQRWQVGIAIALLVVLWGGFSAGTRFVLNTQPAEEVAAARLVQAQLAPGELLATHIPDRVPLAKYSAIAHLVVDWPGAADDSPVGEAELAAARAAGASYLLWDEGLGPAPLPETARVGAAGRYTLYRL